MFIQTSGNPQHRGKGFIYVKEGIQCKQTEIPYSTTLQCVKMSRSPKMSFIVFEFYPLPTATDVFFDDLDHGLK